MRQAMQLAEEAHEAAEVPVGCVFVHTPTNKVIGSGRNRTNETLNGTRHAEFEGIDEIIQSVFFQEEVKRRGGVDKFWADVTLYVTIEPCVMCASALRQLGIKEVYFGAGNDRFGGNGSVFTVHQE
ncbi:tRNA(adenine34) deaminase [Actinomortierella ambigua]|uniref:tRNA(Adenine34) deaminase n=1 Tax=Actinomortierella ambigua TaxID=1343610 RepID=A0A9P6Q1J5_9FUNG|nr:tRNA(adenine34) deaminase [Actinomortierella ambigua]